MPYTSIINEGIRLLEGLESGKLVTNDAFLIAEKLDPVLIFFIFRFLREKYKPGHPAADGVTSRLVELSQERPVVIKMCKEGEEDLINEWFNDTYDMREFLQTPEELIKLLVEKIES